MSRLQQLFQQKQKDILNIYFTAGYPTLDSTVDIIQLLDQSGVDLIEIGMPYSDPLADGPTIQQSGMKALENGMTLPFLFEQIEQARQKTDIPLVMMGYFNQVMQYGERAFFEQCKAVGIDGLILPDLPLDVYEQDYQQILHELGLDITFLITPQTSESRIQKIDELSTGFIYMVSNASITGAKRDISEQQIAYFNRIEQMQLAHPRLIGFGISNRSTFETACRYASGAIIGSAFIKALAADEELSESIHEFIGGIRKIPIEELK